MGVFPAIRRFAALLPLSAVAVLWLPSSVVAAEDGSGQASHTALLATIQQSGQRVSELYQRYLPSNDRLVLGCLKRHLDDIRTVQTAAIGTVARITSAPTATVRDSAMQSLLELADGAQRIEAAAWECLRTQGGEIITYGAENPIPAAPLEDVPQPSVDAIDADPIDVEPEPVERPLSNAQLP